MIETIARKVAPNEEQKTINTMANFGWRLKSSQEINTVDSHLETRNDTLYSVTTKENYVKLLFERDTQMKNYAELAHLERQYAALLNSRPQLSLSSILNKKLLFLLIPLIGIFIVVFSIYKNFREANKKWGEEYQAKAPIILSRARALL